MNSHHTSGTLLAVAAVLIGGPSLSLAQTNETENFTTEPTDWVFLGPARDYGFRNSNNTGGASPAGEAGGIVYRDDIRTHYGDVTLGGRISSGGAFSATGELNIRNAVAPDNEVTIGHYDKDFAGLPGDAPGAGARDAAGIHIAESGDDPLNAFIWRIRMYTDDPNLRLNTDTLSATFADAKGFSYSFNPETNQLTGSILGADGNPLNGQTLTLNVPESANFFADSFGIVSGHHTSGISPDKRYEIYIDGLTYSRAVTGDFDANQLTQPGDFDLFGTELRKPAGEADDRMFDINDDGVITLADRDAILTAINKKLGDTDLDGDVDLNDLGNLASGFQQEGATWGRGDTDLDNDVDLNDLGNLATNFQAGRAQAFAQFDALVPEPAALSLLALGAAGMLRRRRP